MKTSIKRRGSVLLICVAALFVVVAVGLSVMSISANSSRMAFLGWQKAEADSLAISGVNTQVAQLSHVPASGVLNDTAIPSTSLSSSLRGVTGNAGTYSASVLSKATTTVNGQTTTTYVIEGIGTAPGVNTVSRVRAKLAVTSQGMSGLNLGDGAVISNGDVTISGGSFTSDPGGQYRANVYANGKINDSSGANSIDGTASAYVYTNLTGKAHAIVPLTTKMAFPTSTQTNSWKTSWLTQSKQSTSSYPSGNKRLGNYTFNSSGSIKAPIYISGDLTVSGGNILTINTDASAVKPIVVYVTGKVTVSGGSSLVNNGALIVSEGIQTYSGSSAVYSATDPVNCGLFSFSTDLTKAISITGGSGAAQIGVVYAVNGGVTLSGGSTFHGSATAAGVGASATLSGGSSVAYQGGNGSFGPNAPTFTFDRLRDWTMAQ